MTKLQNCEFQNKLSIIRIEMLFHNTVEHNSVCVDRNLYLFVMW